MVNGRLSGNIWIEESGAEGPVTLVLIHGLGANGAVWDTLLPFINRDWRGRCVVPDLRGHGRSRATGSYSFGAFAADIADYLLSDLPPSGGRVAIIGHSLGGALAAFLASGWFGIEVESVLALSVKTRWGEEELAKFRTLSEQPVRFMDSEDEARSRFIRASGLAGLAQPNDRLVDIGITQVPGHGFRFATDPKVVGSTGPQLDTLLRAARVPVRHATGENDPLAPLEDMLPYDPRARTIGGAGHNVHLENPAAVWAMFQELIHGPAATATATVKKGELAS